MSNLPCGHLPELRDAIEPLEGTYRDTCFVCEWEAEARRIRRLKEDRDRAIQVAERATMLAEAWRDLYLKASGLDLDRRT